MEAVGVGGNMASDHGLVRSVVSKKSRQQILFVAFDDKKKLLGQKVCVNARISGWAFQCGLGREKIEVGVIKIEH